MGKLLLIGTVAGDLPFEREGSSWSREAEPEAGPRSGGPRSGTSSSKSNAANRSLEGCGRTAVFLQTGVTRSMWSDVEEREGGGQVGC